LPLGCNNIPKHIRGKGLAKKLVASGRIKEELDVKLQQNPHLIIELPQSFFEKVEIK
jgi:hypothetical protein